MIIGVYLLLKRLGIVVVICLYFYYVGGWFGEHLYLLNPRPIDFPTSFMLGVFLTMAITIIAVPFICLIGAGLLKLIEWVKNG